jgi:hypothetical protein
VEAFKGSPRIHKGKGLVNRLLCNPNRGNDVNNVTADKIKRAEADASKAIKAALLISGVHKCRYGKIKVELANNYLLGTNQNLNTFDKAVQIFEDY